MKKQLVYLLTGWLMCGMGLQARAQVEPLFTYKISRDEACNRWVESQMKQMNLREKIGQLFIYTIAPDRSKRNLALLKNVVHTHKVGGLLFSGGKLDNQALLTNQAQKMADVPLMITFDGEWGLSMRLRGTPVFPKNMVLGCIQDDRLIYEYGQEMARQCRELGVQVNFAPVADVNINPQNPVINVRSFGENPLLVADKVIAYASGLESGRVLSVAKHFPGHGDTDVDSHKALPVLPFTRERLDSVELYPFRKLIHAGLGGVMVGHLQVPVFEPVGKLPSSLSRNVVYTLLTEKMAFKGLIFTDALAMKGVSSAQKVCLQALKAGNDVVLAPRDVKKEIDYVVEAVKKGEFSEEEIDERCRKVLLFKYAMGLNRKPVVRLSGLERRINTPHTRDLIRRLNLAAVTVLNNEKGVLPIHPDVKKVAVLTVGKAKELEAFTNELKKYVEVHTFELGKQMPDSLQQKLRDSLSAYRRIIVPVNEIRLAPYQSFFAKFAPQVPVVYAFFTPAKLMLQIHRAISNASSVVLGHTDSDEVQEQIAALLFGKAAANGRLSAGIGGLFRAGAGLTVTTSTPYHFVPEEYGMRSEVLQSIDTIAMRGIHAGAYPGCQIVVLKNGRTMYNKSFGTFTYEDEKAVSTNDIYDLASLSKTTGTLLAVMKLYDNGRFNLSDPIGDYLPFLKGTNKAKITIRELLLHQSGLPSGLVFYQDAIDKKSYKGSLFKGSKDALHTVQIGPKTFAQPGFRFKEGLTSAVGGGDYTLHVADSLWLHKSFRDVMLKKIADAPLKGKKYVYSCLNFILLQQLIEQLAGVPMDEFLTREFYRPMNLSRTAYLPLRYFRKENIVPSSVDRFLRKETLQGFVHDESAAFLGGISGNAGLFSTAYEVSQVYQMLLNGGEYEGQRYLSKETCQLFTTETSKISRRGLGFDKPDAEDVGSSPCAPSAPASVYGHTGFTGTCAWADPDNGLVYVFLSNRTYPDAWVNKLSNLEIREHIQETLYRALMQPAPVE